MTQPGWSPVLVPGAEHETGTFAAHLPVQIAGDFAYAAAPWYTANDLDSGAVLTFELDPPDLIYANGFD
jgi:hypothetical protein